MSKNIGLITDLLWEKIVADELKKDKDKYDNLTILLVSLQRDGYKVNYKTTCGDYRTSFSSMMFTVEDVPALLRQAKIDIILECAI